MTWDGKLRAPNYDKLEWTNREEHNNLPIKACSYTNGLENNNLIRYKKLIFMICNKLIQWIKS